MKKILVVCLTMLLSLTLAACQSSSFKLKKDLFKVEYGKELSLKAITYVDADKEILNKVKISVDIKKAKECSIITDSQGEQISISGLSVGTYEAKAKYKNEEKKFKIKVADTIKPKFKDFMKEIKVEQNAENVDFTKYFSATDKVGKEEIPATIKVSSKKVDLANLGTYEIKVSATDTNKNKTSKTCKVSVVTKEEAEQGNVTAALDGSKPMSAATKQKQEVQQPEVDNGAPGQPSSGGSNGNTGGSTGGNTGNTGGTPPSSGGNTPPVCDIPIGNSGRWFNSELEAYNWADQLLYGENPGGYLGFNTAGNSVCGYTVNWY